MAKKIYRYPYPATTIKIIMVQEAVKKPKDKPEIPGFEVHFIHGKLVQSCFMEKVPASVKENSVLNVDLEIIKNFEGTLESQIVAIKS